MKLYEAIESIVSEFGKEIINNAKVINMFNDYNAFEESRTFKIILKNLIAEGYMDQILYVRDWSKTQNRIINNFIAEKIKGSNGVINLLTAYNALPGNSLTAAAAMYDKEFLRFCVNEIRKYIKYLSQPSVLYNMGDGAGGEVVRSTARDNMHILCLTNFVAGVEAYLESDTFHKELVALPGYTEVAYWQGNKGATATNDFATNSSIKVTPSSEAGAQAPTDVEQSGIIAVLADRQAIAVGISRRHTGTFYNSIDQYTNMSMSFVEQYIDDMSENGIIFVVTDSGQSNRSTKTTTK